MTLYNPFHARVNLLVHQLGPFLPVKFRVQHLPALLLFLERRPQSLFDQTFRYRFNHSSVNMTVLKNVLEEYFSLPEAHTPLVLACSIRSLRQKQQAMHLHPWHNSNTP